MPILVTRKANPQVRVLALDSDEADGTPTLFKDEISFRIGSKGKGQPLFGRAKESQRVGLDSGEIRIADLNGDGLDELVAFTDNRAAPPADRATKPRVFAGHPAGSAGSGPMSPRRAPTRTDAHSPASTSWRRASVWAFTVVSSLTVCMSPIATVQAQAETAIVGSVRDADTDEPIVGAWIFETERQTHSGADVARVGRARATRSDADGRFSFARSADGLWNFLFGRRPQRRYVFYDPGYGLVRVRVGDDGRTVTVRPSLRDAHLRQADAVMFCNQTREDEMSRTLREVACPPSRVKNFPDGSPRAVGAVDERGRRDGPWTFFRADGSVIARGEYRGGGAIGKWHFERKRSLPSNQD